MKQSLIKNPGDKTTLDLLDTILQKTDYLDLYKVESEEKAPTPEEVGVPTDSVGKENPKKKLRF